MARIRSIHPGIFTDETYMSLSFPARELIKGLWCEADDHGVFEWKPLTIKARIMPADAVDVSEIMTELATSNLIQRFEHGGKPLGAIRNFCKFQRPKKPVFVHQIPDHLLSFVAVPVEDDDQQVPLRKRKCDEQHGLCYYCDAEITHYSKRVNSLELDHKLPLSRGGDDSEDNLVATCRMCNRSKGARTDVEFIAKLGERAAKRHRRDATGSIANAKAHVANASGEVASQMEEGGGSKEEKNSTPRMSAATSQGASADPAKDVVKAFMAARNERWPDAMPANNAMTQAEHARSMLALPGATVELVCELVRDAVKSWKDPNPPGGVGAFKASIPNQIARHVRASTMPAQTQSNRPTADVREFVPVDRNSTLRARLQSYKRDGQWPYGDPAPTSQYCQIDRRLMREVLGEEFMAQHHAPQSDRQAMPMRAVQ